MLPAQELKYNLILAKIKPDNLISVYDHLINFFSYFHNTKKQNPFQLLNSLELYRENQLDKQEMQ